MKRKYHGEYKGYSIWSTEINGVTTYTASAWDCTNIVKEYYTACSLNKIEREINKEYI